MTDLADLIVAALLVALVVALTMRSVRVIPAGKAGVVRRLGRFHAVRQPGLVFVVPVLDQVRLVEMRELPFRERIVAETRDGVVVTVPISVAFQVVDPRLAEPGTRSYPVALVTLVRKVVQENIEMVSVDEQLAQQRSLSDRVRVQVETIADRVGVRINRLTIGDAQRRI